MGELLSLLTNLSSLSHGDFFFWLLFTNSLPDPIILISMDGFRPDYLDRNITPNINYLGKMISSFLARETDG